MSGQRFLTAPQKGEKPLPSVETPEAGVMPGEREDGV